MSDDLKRYRVSFTYEGQQGWEWIVAHNRYEVFQTMRARYPGIIDLFIVED